MIHPCRPIQMTYAGYHVATKQKTVEEQSMMSDKEEQTAVAMSKEVLRILLPCGATLTGFTDDERIN